MPRRPIPFDLRRAHSRSRITVREWRELREKWDHRCAYCGEGCDLLTIDHVEPTSRGGEDVQENVVPCCRPCNSSKGDMLLLEWVLTRRFMWQKVGLGATYRSLRIHRWWKYEEEDVA